jgi:hypothetical protein
MMMKDDDKSILQNEDYLVIAIDSTVGVKVTIDRTMD